MKPYGLNNKIRHNFRTYSLSEGDVWWQAEMNCVNKKRARRQGKKEIQEQLKEITNDC